MALTPPPLPPARFSRLPPCAKVLLTSRPQTQPLFSAWDPEWILPEAAQNLDDMHLVLSKRLQESGAVQQRDIGSATELLVRKSQVRTTWFRQQRDIGSATELLVRKSQVMTRGLGSSGT